MKCVTLQQPWAWAIVFGPKRIENRTWITRHRGPLLIHAGLSQSRLAGTTPESWHAELPGLPPFDQLQFGAIIGVCELTDCVPVAQVAGQPFAEGPVCWILSKVRPITPIPYKGQQLIYDVPDHLLGNRVA